jgi:hypothetical protein
MTPIYAEDKLNASINYFFHLFIIKGISKNPLSVSQRKRIGDALKHNLSDLYIILNKLTV